MTKSYFSHLSTILVVHVMVLMGTWQLSQSDYVKSQVKAIGNGVLKLQVAASVMRKNISVTRPSVRPVPVNPALPKTAPVPKQEVAAAPVQGGSAQGSEAGTSANGTTDALAVYKAELRAMIDKNKSYPPMSRRLGQTGTVVVAFTLLEDGHIIDVKIEKPSPYERLNLSAMEAVKKVERFKPIPKEVGEQKMDIRVPVKFITI